MRILWGAYITVAAATFLTDETHWAFPYHLWLLSALGLVSALLGCALAIRSRFERRTTLQVAGILFFSQWWLIRYLAFAWMWSHGGYTP
jgi:hypothetical protein